MVSHKNKLTDILQESGLRYTRQRQAVLDELNRVQDHRDVEEIYFSMKELYGWPHRMKMVLPIIQWMVN